MSILKTSTRRALLCGIASLSLLTACSGGGEGRSVNEGPASYAKEDITLRVGFNPGGGTDTNARLINKYLTQHITGNPDVVVENLPGAGGIRALNQTFEGTKPDGNTVLLAPISLLVPLLGEPGVRYKLDEFEVVGGFRTGPIMQFARKDTAVGGVESGADISKAKALVLGGVRVSSSLDLMPRLALDSLNMDYRYVPGYGSENTVRNAIQTDEVNSFGGTFSGYKSAVIPTLIEPGVVSTLWQFPYRAEDGTYPRSEFAPNVPTFMEVYEEINGTKPSGESWQALKLALDLRSVADNMLLAPPGTDPEKLALLRAGYAAVMSDPDFQSEVSRVLGYNYQVIPVDYINARFEEMSSVDQGALNTIKEIIASAE